MSRTPMCRTLLALLIAGGLTACGGTDTTNTITVTQVPACSQANPLGSCDAGSQCVAGACVVSSTLCSPTNLTGTCSSGTTCLGGGCVVSSALCSGTAPAGLCASGSACVGGTCVLASTLCSVANPTGACASGTTCFGGGCVAASLFCSNTVPTGLCQAGQVCAGGTCVASGSICSSSNLSGSCPSGTTCQAPGICTPPAVDPCTVAVYTQQPEIAIAKNASSTPAGVLTIGGLKFKDLSKDGNLDPYEDWRLSEICRAKDLTSKLNLAQKIALMTEVSNIGSGTLDGSVSANIATSITTGNLRQALIRISNTIPPASVAKFLNNLQELSESAQWGIPFVVTADPSHGISHGMVTGGSATSTPAFGSVGIGGASNTGGTGSNHLAILSAWPQPYGIGAINDPAIAFQAGDTVRREYRGMGLRWELGPQADIATEPRWARVNNTFGENPVAVGTMVAAFIQGMQGVGDGGLKGGGIAATLKHFPGTGPDQGGLDSHSAIGRFNVFPGNNFMAHVYPFRAAVAAGAAAVMPSYSIYKSQWQWDPLQVGASMSKELITDLLKTQLGFTGLVSSDWGVIGKAYGVENATNAEKGALFIKAGSHQLGAESASGNIQLAYQSGLISDDELNNAITKILEMSFKLGLFENPYTDYTTIAGHTTAWNADTHSAAARTNGFNAQKMAMVLLRNREHSGANTSTANLAYLPIDGSRTFTFKDPVTSATSTQAVDDANGDGTISVYFDGINKSIVGVSTTSTPIDTLTDVFGDYDYTAAGSATSTPIVATSDITAADLAIIRIVARKGAYSGLDAGVPLSFDAPFPGTQNDGEAAAAKIGRNKVLDAFRVRDGYTKLDTTVVPAANPTLKIVLVMHMDRPAIVKPFINGLNSLNEDGTTTDKYPLVSNDANIFVAAAGTSITKGVDAFLVDFGAFDRAVLDVLFNKHKPSYLAPGQTVFHYGTARLPAEIPSTDAEVAAQYEDVPADTANPSYKLGAGITYSQ